MNPSAKSSSVPSSKPSCKLSCCFIANFTKTVTILFGLSITYLLAFPFIFLGLTSLFLIQKITFKNFLGKLGFYPKKNSQKKAHYWIHLSSLGEWNTSKKFITELANLDPETPILITYFNQDTTSASEFNPSPSETSNFTAFFLPLESPHSYFYLARHYRIKCLIVIETEIWPILLFTMMALRKKAFLVNATLFKKEAKSYTRFGFIFRPLLKSFQHIYPSSENSKKHFLTLGIDTHKISSTFNHPSRSGNPGLGNLKLDLPPNTLQFKKITTALRQKKVKKKNSFTLLFASVHLEEIPQLQTALQHFSRRPEFKVILVFREILSSSKLNQVISLFSEESSKKVEIIDNSTPNSQLSDYLNITMTNTTVWNRYGDLPHLYASSDLVIMGGTFAPIGGHNFLEAIAENCPVILGPHYFHFTELVDTFREYLYFSPAPTLQTTIEEFHQKDLSHHHQSDYGRKKLMKFQGISQRLAKDILNKITT